MSKKICVLVKTKSKRELIKEVSENEFEVHVKELPLEGKANKAVIKALSKYLGIPKREIELISGVHFKKKVFKIIS